MAGSFLSIRISSGTGLGREVDNDSDLHAELVTVP